MEYRIRIIADGIAVNVEGINFSCPVPDSMVSGLQMIFSLMGTSIRDLSFIAVSAILFKEGRHSQICAFDIWAQAGEEGFYLPMALCAKLFSQNGIPYYHCPFMS